MARVRTRSGKVVRPRYEELARARGTAVPLAPSSLVSDAALDDPEALAEDASARERFFRLCARVLLAFLLLGVVALVSQVYLVWAHAQLVVRAHAEVAAVLRTSRVNRAVLVERGWTPRAYLRTLDDEARVHLQRARYDDAVRIFRAVVGARGGAASARLLRLSERPPYAAEIHEWRTP